MAELIWSPQSVEDLDAICRFVARDSHEYAIVVAQKIVETAEAIAMFPEAGSIVPEFDEPNVRERFTYRYRVIYRVTPQGAVILTIMHSARDLRTLP